MNEDRDDYLWRAGAAGSDDTELVELEQILAQIRWQPRPLEGEAPALVEPRGATVIELVRPEPREPRGVRWSGLVTGLLAAAAVFALMMLQPPSETPTPSSEAPVNPAASPQLHDPFGSTPRAPSTPTRRSPDLKDPFGSNADPGFLAPIDEQAQHDVSAPGQVSPDLKDPFAGVTTPPPSPTDTPKKGPASKRVSPDLQDPFAANGDKDEPVAEEVSDVLKDDQPTLTDPFTGEPKPVDPRSPDLKDPFE